MAKITLKDGSEYLKKLGNLERDSRSKIIGAAIYDGAAIVADEIRKNIEALPVGKGWGKPERLLPGPPESTKKAMLDALGVTPMKENRDFGYDVKIGFDGYDNIRTKRWPKGRPVQMLARAVESGTSFMAKNPFVRPAVSHTRKAAEKAMGERVDKEIEKIMK